jgi:hypothetical protein
MSGVLIPNLDTGSTPVSSIPSKKPQFARRVVVFCASGCQSPKKFRGNRTFSQYFASFLEIIARKQFQVLSRSFHPLSTVPDRQITPQFTTFQQPPNPSQQVIHRVFLRRQIVTFIGSGSTISIPTNLWQNLATSVRNACPDAGQPQEQTDSPRTLVEPIDLMSEVTYEFYCLFAD